MVEKSNAKEGYGWGKCCVGDGGQGEEGSDERDIHQELLVGIALEFRLVI